MRENSEKKVLVIAYHFPPELAVGSIRPKKAVKFLGELGWKPYVLTIREKYISNIDPDLEKQLPGVEISRTTVWPTPLQLAVALKAALPGKGGQPRNSHPKCSQIEKDTGKPGNKGWMASAKRGLVSLNWIPDSRMGWMVPAVAAGLKIIRKNRISLILATSPPFTCSVIGAVLACITKARLVVDFRDPWTHLQDRKPAEVVSPVSTRIESWLEKKVISKADTVVATTKKYRDALRSAHGDQPADKFVTIYNGYDAHDIEEVKSKTITPGIFTISYVGTFYRDRNPEYLLKALAELVDEGTLSRKNLRINFVGHVLKAGGSCVEEMIAASGLKDQVSLTGMVPYIEALEYMASSSVLVLLAPSYYYQIPAKTFEYLAFKKPILGLMDEGAAADLIRRLNAGLIVRQHDVPGIKTALVRLHRNHVQNGKEFQRYDPSEFERRVTIGQMADVLGRIQSESDSVQGRAKG